MSENPLTFSELRKIQKQEKRQEELSDLEDNFILRVSNYLEMKKDVDDREYKSAKRVFDKITGLRQQKIVKNARLAVGSEVNNSELNLLPREKELFLELKNVFQEFDRNVEKVIEGEETAGTPDIELEEGGAEDAETVDEEDDGENNEEGYEMVKIISDVPEFMGTDLESYGPFEEGEEVEIPEDNAEILVNRGNAEEIGQ